MIVSQNAFRFSLLLTSTLVGVGAPATAQSVAAAPEAATAADDGIPAIIVTAQRREERLQQVPLSITAITGKEIKNADIRDANRLEQVTPGLRIARSGASIRPAIRGVYTEAAGVNSDPRIGFYIDEIYQARLGQAAAAFVDLERVEVQKGPQGTLFGRNTLGGNIALTTAIPKDELHAGVDAIYGNYDRVRVEGFLNVPITDGVAARVAVAGERHEGYLRSTVSRDADLNDLDYGFVRGSLRIAPPSMDGRLEILLRGSYYRERDHGYNAINSKVIGALVDPALIRQPGQSLTYNGVTYPLPFGYNGGNYATGSLYPYSTALRDNIPDVNGADIGLPVPGIYQSIYDYPARQRLTQKNFSATVSFELNENVRLRSITGYADYHQSAIGDGDGTPIPFSAYYVVGVAQTFQQEFQVQSAKADSPLQYTIGAFYLNDRSSDAGALIYPTHNYSTATAAANGLPVYYNVGNSCGFSYLPTNAPASCAISNLNSADGAGPNQAKTKSYAAYGQVSYRFADKLTLTAGVRYTVDDKTYASLAQVTPYVQFVGGYVAAQNAAAVTAGQPIPFPNAAGYHAVFPFNEDRATFANFDCGSVTPGDFAPAGSNTVVGTVPNYLFSRCGARKFKYATYRLAADYRITPDNLVYASYSTGKHSGGFGTSVATPTSPQGEFAPFDTENVRAFEIGSKNSFWNHRVQLNFAAFYNKYTNNQIQGLIYVQPNGTTPGQNIATITNAGDTEAPGAELSIIARPVRPLTLSLSVNYLHARNSVYPSSIFGSGLCFVSQGAGGPCATNSIANGAGLGSGFFPNPATNPELFVPVTNAAGAITAYQSLFFGEKTRVQNTPDWSAHFSAAYEIDLGDTGMLTPEVDVLYSDKYLLSASIPNFYQHSYAKIDARLSYVTKGGGITVQGFVQNLTDKATIGRATTANLAVSGTYSDPRTYGVKVGLRF